MHWLGPGAGACLVLAGCGTLTEIRPLATGHAGVAAYELAGADLPSLRREVRRLCPQGADVLRQSNQEQTPGNGDAPARQWISQVSAWVEAPQRTAQLMVVCRPTDTRLLPAAEPKALSVADPTMARPAVAVALPPIGPLSVEW